MDGIDELAPRSNGNGKALPALTTEEKVDTIFDVMGRLDREFEDDREARRDLKVAFDELKGKVERYHDAVEKMTQSMLEAFQKSAPHPNPEVHDPPRVDRPTPT